MMSTKLDCKEMFARLSEFIDGELNDELCKCFSNHIEDCKPCQAFIATLKKTIDLCRDYDPDELPHPMFSPEEISEFKAAYDQSLQTIDAVD